jgi:hypothetical protein
MSRHPIDYQGRLMADLFIYIGMRINIVIVGCLYTVMILPHIFSIIECNRWDRVGALEKSTS